MPTGAIKQQYSMSPRGNLQTDLLQVLGHRLATNRRHDDGSANAALGTHRAEDISRVMVVIANRRRSRATSRPDIGQRAFLTDTGFIAKPDLQRLAGGRGGHHLGQQAGESRLNASCAAASFFG